MKLSFSPYMGLAPLLPALTIFFCLGMPMTAFSQGCANIPVNSNRFNTLIDVQVTSNGKIITISSFLKGQLSPGCTPGTCHATYRLTSKLPSSAEITLPSQAGWLTRNCSNKSISLNPTRDAIHVDFHAPPQSQPSGPAFVLRIKVPASHPCDANFLRLVDGIVEVDIYIPAKRAAATSGKPYPNPCTNQLHWQNDSEVAAHCRLLSTAGSVVAAGTTAPGTALRLDTQSVPAGMYLLECQRPGLPNAVFRIMLKR